MKSIIISFFAAIICLSFVSCSEYKGTYVCAKYTVDTNGTSTYYYGHHEKKFINRAQYLNYMKDNKEYCEKKK